MGPSLPVTDEPGLPGPLLLLEIACCCCAGGGRCPSCVGRPKMDPATAAAEGVVEELPLLSCWLTVDLNVVVLVGGGGGIPILFPTPPTMLFGGPLLPFMTADEVDEEGVEEEAMVGTLLHRKG